MGDPKKLRKKYTTPSHPWNEAAILENKELTFTYGLGTKREIFIADSFVKKYRGIAKRLMIDESAQAALEKGQMLQKLQNLGLLQIGADLKEGLARSVKQARQFITHRHIKVGEKEITSPGYLVSVAQEAQITFKDNSSLSDIEHAERVDPNADIKKEAESLKVATKDVPKEKGKPLIKTPEEQEVEKGLSEEIAKETKDSTKSESTKSEPAQVVEVKKVAESEPVNKTDGKATVGDVQ
jgi:small subunit ribosomal protein S4